jgi:MFS transporter, ACS family, hexuronate transporter
MRWWVLTLLTLATIINYLDRIVFSVLSPIIRQDLGFNNQEYGLINGAFQIAYTVGFLLMGKVIDRFGTRIGYGLSIAWWSTAAGLHALAASSGMLAFWRGMLGIGEAGNFPAAIKSVAEWFPVKDRAFATGIFNAGTNVASMIGPPLFYWMQGVFGWRACFLITGGLGFVWLIAWMTTYRLPLKPVEPEDKVPNISWGQALTLRQTWGFAAAKFFSDPVWWFYLYWLPPYLYDVRKFDLKAIGWALPFVYLTADIGSVAGGWLSGFLIRRGWSNGRARRFSMLVFALMMPVGALTVLAENPFLSILLISLATSAHQGWSANLFTTVSDVFPRNAVASVTGIGGCLGGLGGVLFSAVIPGYVVQNFGYTPVFLTMGCFHIIGWFLLRWLMGSGEKLEMNEVPVAKGTSAT